MKLNKYRDNDVVLGDKRNTREIWFKVIVFLCFFVLFLRLLYLQVLQGNEFSYLAERNQYKLIKIDSPRGKIFDSKGKLVVTNGTGYRLIYSLGREENEEYIKEIANLTDKTEEIVRKRIKYGEIFPYTKDNVLFEDLEEEKAHKLMEIINNYPYLEVQVYSKRKYLYDKVASHTIGYVKKISEKEYENLKEAGYTPRDMIGKLGIEKTYDDLLRGRNGFKYIEVNALNKIEREVEKVKSPIVGKNLHMSINMELQQYMEEEFEKDGRSGSFVALNPKTGEIITIVSYPTYSLNTFSSQISPEEWNKISNDPRKILTNKTIAGEYPPGSPFKIVTGTAALDLKKVTPDEMIFDSGKHWLIDKRNAEGEALGWLNFNRALAKSDNVYFYEMGNRLGIENIDTYARYFGLGEKTGINLVGEAAGNVASPEYKRKVFDQDWYLGETFDAAIGQSFHLVTPLQMAVLLSQVANGGTRYQPYVVSRVDNPDGTPAEIFGPKNLGVLPVPKNIMDLIREGLRDVTSEGTAGELFKGFPVAVAGKTGTAENAHGRDHGWFVAYAPYDKPQIVVVALVEQGGFGAGSAGPIVRDILSAYFKVPTSSSKTTDTKTTDTKTTTNKKETQEIKPSVKE